MTIGKPSLTMGDTHIMGNKPRYYHVDHLTRPAGGADECSVLYLIKYIIVLKGEL